MWGFIHVGSCIPGPHSCKASHMWGSYTCWLLLTLGLTHVRVHTCGVSHTRGLTHAEQTDNTQSELQQPHLLKQSQVISFLFSFSSTWQVISLQTNLVPCTCQANAQALFIFKRWLASVASSFFSFLSFTSFWGLFIVYGNKQNVNYVCTPDLENNHLLPIRPLY